MYRAMRRAVYLLTCGRWPDLAPPMDMRLAVALAAALAAFANSDTNLPRLPPRGDVGGVGTVCAAVGAAVCAAVVGTVGAAGVNDPTCIATGPNSD